METGAQAAAILHLGGRTAQENYDLFSSDAGQRAMINVYVDDCLMSRKSEDDAITVVAYMKELLKKGGFNLTKWVSNSRNVLSMIPEEYRSKDGNGLDLNFEALPVCIALGVSWNVHSDCFEFQITNADKPLTRRGLLSAVSSMYDPMGFICPFTLTPNKIIQDLTRKKLSWD